jgi:hypothetical protein
MNYYEILEIRPDSSTEEVERAFRRVARQVHPDLNSGDPGKAEARMKQLNEIRDTLTDPLLRAGYDERLRLERERDRPSQPPPREASPAPVPPAVVRGEAPQTAGGRGPWFLLMLGASLTSALLWHWRHELQSAVFPTEVTSSMPVQTAPPPAPPQSPVATAARTVPRRRVVRLGSSVNEVFAAFGTPTRVEPGKQSGDAVLHYGHLWLEIRNGRVTGGDAAALR